MRESQADEIVTLLRSIDRRLAAVEAAWAHAPMTVEGAPPAIIPREYIANLRAAHPAVRERRLMPAPSGGMIYVDHPAARNELLDDLPMKPAAGG